MTHWDTNSAQRKGMSNRNEVTGDLLQSKIPSKEYKANYDSIFRKDKATEETDNKEGEQE